MNDRARIPSNERQSRLPRVVRVLSALIAGFIVLQLVAVYAVDTTGWRLWGINYPAFFTQSIPMLLLALLPLLFLIPAVLHRVALAEKKPENKKGKGAQRAFGGVVSWVLIYGAVAAAVLLLPVGYAFLGDGAYYMSELYRMIRLPDYHPSLLHLTSSMTGYAVVALTRLLSPEDLSLPYTIIDTFAAVILVSLFLLLRRRIPRDSVWLAAALFAGSAGSLMLFGYVEMYALQLVFLIGFFVTSWAFFQGKSSVWIPSILFVLAIAAGLSAIIFLPAWVFLLIARREQDRESYPYPRVALLLLAALAITIPAAYLFAGPNGNGYLIPLIPSQNPGYGIGLGMTHYTLISGAHVVDIVNLVVLHAIGPLCLAGAVLVTHRRSIAWSSPMMLFATISLLAGGIGIVFGHAALGLARDWDLAAVFTLPVAFLALVLATQFLETRARGFILPLVLVFQVSTLGRWVLLNHDTPASARRMYSLVSMDLGTVLPASSFSGLENLRKFHSVDGDRRMHARLLDDMWATGLDTYNVLTKQLSIAVTEENADDRVEKLRAIVDRVRDRLIRGLPVEFPSKSERSRSIDFLTRIVLASDRFGLHAFADGTVARLERELPEWKGGSVFRALRDESLAPSAVARAAELSISRDCMDPALLNQLGAIYRVAGEFVNAATAYRRAIEADDTSFPTIYLSFARLYSEELHDRDSAVVWLKACVERCGNTEAAQKARDILVNQMKLPIPE